MGTIALVSNINTYIYLLYALYSIYNSSFYINHKYWIEDNDIKNKANTRNNDDDDDHSKFINNYIYNGTYINTYYYGLNNQFNR